MSAEHGEPSSVREKPARQSHAHMIIQSDRMPWYRTLGRRRMRSTLTAMGTHARAHNFDSSLACRRRGICTKPETLSHQTFISSN